VFCLHALLCHPAAAQLADGFLRKVSTAEIVHDLEASLTDVLGGHASAAESKRLAAIEASTWATFQSMPKNAKGRLASPAVHHVVRSYFAKEHGWHIKGLEYHGMQTTVSEVHEVSILQDKAPMLVEGLLASRHEDHGLGFTDIVAMVAVLEQLMFDESITLLQAAYRLNGESVAAHIDEVVLHRLLRSYLVLFGQGAKADLSDSVYHQDMMARKEMQSFRYQQSIHFESNAVANFEYSLRDRINPFVPRRYSFDVVAEIVADMAQRYGKWQNADCRDMKEHLVALDPEGSGRVPLGHFYAQPASDSYHFVESADYLRKIGALDESSAESNVFITNYVEGPSNCIASSSYYSVCCLNSCDSIMDEIEHGVLAPTASPKRLLHLVYSISTEPAFPDGLVKKLQAIADRHHGEVPIHGRLFAQWLHFAFPHECPFPSIVGSSEVFQSSQWRRVSASDEERNTHMVSATPSKSAVTEGQLEELWSDHEVLPAHGEPLSPVGTTTAGVVRVAVQIATLCLILRSVYGAWRAAVGAGGASSLNKAKKDDDYSARALGFCV
jgi:hypothetical protein